MEIRKNLVSPSKYGIKCPYTMNPEYITVHNTYNDAPAANEVKYMINNNNEVSFHVAVDDQEAVQGIPWERNAWACGDGNGPGNRQSISVEICYSKSGGDRYYKAEENAVHVVRQLMSMYNIPIENVRTHQSWSGKYCPHRILAEGRWNSFIARVQKAYNGGDVSMTTDDGRRKIKTGGLGYDAIKEVSEVLCSKGIKGAILFEGEAPYVLTEKLANPKMDNFTAWLDERNWYYEYLQ
ncbi:MULTISPECIES: N-acetylmuramoyl-L-alanine amidase [Bacillus cereus group]|uniref:N-acetylmuramoyl-L-alanine amidase n=1 Tax=Bacillus cereus group TaxID=86661 RepID=UPI001F57EE6C|nr:MULTISPECIES: N-acetylmuramoyl-L-alanine amidase [unclassified Bacillus cereus group]